MSESPAAAPSEPRLRGLIVVGIMVVTLALIVLLVAREAVPSAGYAAYDTPESLITIRSFALADRGGRARQALQLEASGKQDVRIVRLRLRVFDDRNGNEQADAGEALFEQARQPDEPQPVLRIGPTTADWEATLSAPMLEYEVEFSNGLVERHLRRLRGSGS